MDELPKNVILGSCRGGVTQKLFSFSLHGYFESCQSPEFLSTEAREELKSENGSIILLAGMSVMPED
jgi:hypothetical protein